MKFQKSFPACFVFVAGLTVSTSAFAQLVQYTDVRGVVTVNGVPTPGVQVAVRCCDTGLPIACPAAVGVSAGAAPDLQYTCIPGAVTNYLIGFNTLAAGGSCESGCSSIPGLNFGGFVPNDVFVEFTYSNCPTVVVPCSTFSNATFASQSCVPGTGWGGAFINVDISCSNCPVCVDPALGLGAAGGCALLELGSGRVVLGGPSGGVQGDVCVAQGKLSLSQKETISGKVQLGAGATLVNDSGRIVGDILKDVDLTAQVNAALVAASTDANLPCTQTFDILDGNTVSVITGVAGLNVICVKDISLSSNHIVISGPASARFVFNVSGNFVVAGEASAPQIRVDNSSGLQPSAVLFNIPGQGTDVVVAGGSGGVNCCGAIVDGTILASGRNIVLGPGLVNGEVISGKDINVVAGSKIVCPVCR